MKKIKFDDREFLTEVLESSDLEIATPEELCKKIAEAMSEEKKAHALKSNSLYWYNKTIRELLDSVNAFDYDVSDFNDWCISNSCWDGMFLNMSEIDDLYQDLTVTEVIDRFCNDDFSSSDEYFKEDSGHGVESFSEDDAKDEILKYHDEFLDEFVEELQPDLFDNDFIDDITNGVLQLLRGDQND